jgi:hypothetical protein
VSLDHPTSTSPKHLQASSGAARETSRVALVTCAELADLDPDDRLLITPLAAHGIIAEPAVWDDPTVDWDAFDLVVLRSTWDYAPRRDEFIAWAASVPRLANPAGIVAWNTDKRYLDDLKRFAVPVVETTWINPGGPGWAAPDSGEYVIKPAIGSGSKDAGRYRLDDRMHRDLAGIHVERLISAGRPVMIQPYLAAVDTIGETAMLYFNGIFSHAVRKGPMLTGPDSGDRDVGLYVPEEVSSRKPTDAERFVAAGALAALDDTGLVKGPEDLLYGRVDLIPGPDGMPVVVEFELTEPSVFLATSWGAAQTFAAAIAARLG